MYAIREAWEETILMLNGKFQAIIFFFLVLAFIFFFPSFFLESNHFVQRLGEWLKMSM